MIMVRLTLYCRRPNICSTLARTDWSQSLYGALAGGLVFLLTLLELVIFYTYSDQHHDTVLDLEFLSKMLNTTANCLGFITAVVAFFKIRTMVERKNPLENTLDLFLLDFGVFFIYVYSVFTITVGVFNTSHSIPGIVLSTNGVIEIIAVTFQTIFIHQLLMKTIESVNILPGRNLVVFLSFLNFSIWLYDTFELQKSQASLIEAR